MSLFIRVLGGLLLLTAGGFSTPQQTLRDGEPGYSLQQPAEVPSQLYITPTVPPPTVPTIPPRQVTGRPLTIPLPPSRQPPPPPPRSPSQPDQLYTQPETGDASKLTGSVLFPENLNLQSPPGRPSAPPSPPPPRPPPSRPSGPSPRPLTPAPAPPQGGGAMVGMPYEFEWEVNDLENGNLYSHVQNSDGNVAQGSYRVLLPDGRLQIVEFIDRGRGYEATVRYEVYSGGPQVL